MAAARSAQSIATPAPATTHTIVCGLLLVQALMTASSIGVAKLVSPVLDLEAQEDGSAATGADREGCILPEDVVPDIRLADVADLECTVAGVVPIVRHLRQGRLGKDQMPATILAQGRAGLPFLEIIDPPSPRRREDLQGPGSARR